VSCRASLHNSLWKRQSCFLSRLGQYLVVTEQGFCGSPDSNIEWSGIAQGSAVIYGTVLRTDPWGTQACRAAKINLFWHQNQLEGGVDTEGQDGENELDGPGENGIGEYRMKC
jgi:hypothetical protein